jgi:hypothetical protein
MGGGTRLLPVCGGVPAARQVVLVVVRPPHQRVGGDADGVGDGYHRADVGLAQQRHKQQRGGLVDGPRHAQRGRRPARPGRQALALPLLHQVLHTHAALLDEWVGRTPHAAHEHGGGGTRKERGRRCRCDGGLWRELSHRLGH